MFDERKAERVLFAVGVALIILVCVCMMAIGAAGTYVLVRHLLGFTG
jgi:hypothetical protein